MSIQTVSTPRNPALLRRDIGAAIQQFVEAQHYSVVREYCGHGIGQVFHEDPQVLHYGEPGTGVELVPGMTFLVLGVAEPRVRIVSLAPGKRQTE